MAKACMACPVCRHRPRWHPSMVKDAESIGCNLEAHCPDDAFDFQTDYLAEPLAIDAWNAAVGNFNSTKEGQSDG